METALIPDVTSDVLGYQLIHNPAPHLKPVTIGHFASIACPDHL
jgi:hypothetical protein